MPIDRSPHFGEVMQPDNDIPETPDKERPVAGKPDIARRPSLPANPETMAVDIEDEEADPVVDTGPGIDTRG